MSSFVTSFVGLFVRSEDGVPSVDRIEIPLIQRDYAQGRKDEAVTRIRDAFLEAIHLATTGIEPLGLDFIYGEVSEGTLRPLDGQQRLTTLFLLHWYVASRTDHLDEIRAVLEFAYATRPSARRFCEQLMENALPSNASPAAWITDQPWNLYLWQHDPTIQSMLVMLDAIHDRFADDDLEAVWSELVDTDKPAISFHLLPIDNMGSAEDLYIKMNSRGKPLTEFENFKAQLEKALGESARADELADRIDGIWSDVLWPLRGPDNLFDEKFLNYIRFIVDLCEWREGLASVPLRGDLARAERSFGPGNPVAAENLEFLFAAFDTWVREDGDGVEDTDTVFGDLLAITSMRNGVDQRKLPVFGDLAVNINLFRACCGARTVGSRRALMMYAVLLHRIHSSEDFPRRLRIVRNLIEASANEIRPHAMPRLLADVQRVILDDEIEAVSAFNTPQQRDEVLKRGFLALNPQLSNELFHLEDHDLLRGCLMSFELDAATFERQALIFRTIFSDAALLPALSGALLSVGDYSREIAVGKYQLGSPTQLTRWRELLAGDAPSRDGLNATRMALGHVLELAAAESDLPLKEVLLKIQQDWIETCEANTCFDWRYYLVKYPSMREGSSGIYATPSSLGFSLCMLEGKALNGYYRDPFLLAVAREGDAQGAVWGSIEDKPDGPWFTGYASADRWMRLRSSGLQMRCFAKGFVLQVPAEFDSTEVFDRICSEKGLLEVNGSYVLEVPNNEVKGAHCDASDRIQLGAALLSALVAAGL